MPDSLKNDNLPRMAIIRPGGKADTITSTSNNYQWGIDDSPVNFDNLPDTIEKVFNQPGHWSIQSLTASRYGCIDGSVANITVGHYATIKADNTVICVNDFVNFNGVSEYFLPYNLNSTGLDTTPYWKNPVAARHGRKPTIEEAMEWDLDGDGIIDYIGTNPVFKYKKTGSYTVIMYSQDSLGCKQKTVLKDFIKVINATAFFSVAPPGDTRYCSGSHFFSFLDSSYISLGFKDSLHKFHINSWTWDFGDGAVPITITDSTKKNVGHIYIKNGDYTVTLTVRPPFRMVMETSGVPIVFQEWYTFLVPFLNSVLLVPLKVAYLLRLPCMMNHKKAKVHEFLLGDGTSVTSNGDSIVYLTYKRPGVFSPTIVCGRYPA